KRHVAINAFVLPSLYFISFMPDAYRPIISDGPVELRPGRQMLCITRLSVCEQVVETAPILHNHYSAPVNGGVSSEQAPFRGIITFMFRLCPDRYVLTERIHNGTGWRQRHV